MFFFLPDITFINGIQIYFTEKFLNKTYQSCSKVSMPSTGQLALDLMCGEYGSSRCNPQRFFQNLGNADNPFVPFQIDYVASEAPVDRFTPNDPQVVPCNRPVNVSIFTKSFPGSHFQSRCFFRTNRRPAAASTARKVVRHLRRFHRCPKRSRSREATATSWSWALSSFAVPRLSWPHLCAWAAIGRISVSVVELSNSGRVSAISGGGRTCILTIHFSSLVLMAVASFVLSTGRCK